jgi:hypothetical protein
MGHRKEETGVRNEYMRHGRVGMGHRTRELEKSKQLIEKKKTITL